MEGEIKIKIKYNIDLAFNKNANRKTAKIENNFTNISFNICPLATPEQLMGVLWYICTVFIVLIFQSIIRINIRVGGNKNHRRVR